MTAVQSKGAPLAGGGRDMHHTTSRKLPHRGKKGLRSAGVPVYGYSAPAKSGAGIGVPVITEATHDAPSVFFCVVSSVHPFFSVPGIILGARRIMVGWVGASSGAPVSFVSGYANPAQSTTSEIGVSGGGLNHTKEAAIMATTPTQNTQFIWIIAAVRRDCPQITAKIHHVSASTEREARRLLARDHICFFAGRLPAPEVAA
ncbi:host cell division inhibitor Icd-like protein [Klebsiella pneumoniae]|uniref:host cell division inhibitor Icd-like protein n=1 Tax=Klebsiella pneumoniae TaxID=573 RepID=UPI0020CE8451|nr:host cell division inhibitor Icd-like protein [Klebsiella pneumoniae]MCQ0572260.1 host cell division inhibitor Icd-like protein [Klebsiella pneumoniae]